MPRFSGQRLQHEDRKEGQRNRRIVDVELIADECQQRDRGGARRN